jgi:hypothetical protein
MIREMIYILAVYLPSVNFFRTVGLLIPMTGSSSPIYSESFRPSFTDVLHRISDIIIDAAIRNKAGRTFWRKYFKKQVYNRYIIDSFE